MKNFLPTAQGATWTLTNFHDTFIQKLSSDREASELRLYFYAVTNPGWSLVRKAAKSWLKRKNNREIIAYVGTDHGITDPNALANMQTDGVTVKLLVHYNGIFHPKVVWFVLNDSGTIIVGSNNLSLDGLKHNIEFATVMNFSNPNKSLLMWHSMIESSSETLTSSLLDSYRKEKEDFGVKRAEARVASTFTWSKRRGGNGTGSRGFGGARKGDLILEIMDRETGAGGSQIQIPMEAAKPFFGLPNLQGGSITVHLQNRATKEDHHLTMTRYSNHTTRLVIHELDYRDRPCLILFRRRSGGRVYFEVIKKSLEPARYRQLLSQCGSPTRTGSRRWGIK